MSCPFCEINEKIFESEMAQAFFDKSPVTQGHMLITPKRHVSSYFDLTQLERDEMANLLDKCKVYLDEKIRPEGYNIGINVGKAAGQTIFHCHVHLIPRQIGDVENPVGGVRAVVPEKQNYLSENKTSG